MQVNYEDALSCSNDITSLLFHYCMRIQPTGALRRRESSVDPIEMIVSPQVVETDSYWNSSGSNLGGEVPGTDRLDAGVRLLVDKGVLNRVQNYSDDTVLNRSDRIPPYVVRYRQVTIMIHRVIKPSDWGVAFLLRTGDDDFVRFLESRAVEKGFRIDGECLRKDGMPVEAPEESDVFSLFGLNWVEPENRNRGFLVRQGLA